MGTYSRGTYVTLPTDDADLSNTMSAGEVSDLATINNVFVGQNLSGQIAAQQYKNTCSASLANLLWVGQGDLAPSVSPIILQAYNYSTAAWVGQATNAAAATNATCTLAASVGATQYLSPGGYTTARVYQSAIVPTPIVVGNHFNTHNTTMGLTLGGNAPADTSIGDLMVAFFVSYIVPNNIVIPGGWNRFTGLNDFGTGIKCSVSYRVFEVGDTSWTWSVDTNDAYLAIVIVTLKNPNTTPLDTFSRTGGDWNTATTFTITGFSTAYDNELLLLFQGDNYGQARNGATVGGQAMTLVDNDAYVVTTMISYYMKTSAGATGDATDSWVTNSIGNAALVAIRSLGY